jgi:hypothetical protein
MRIHETLNSIIIKFFEFRGETQNERECNVFFFFKSFEEEVLQ